MVLMLLRCLSVLLLVLQSGSSAEATKQSQIYNTYPTMIMHDTFPADVPPDNPLDDVPTFDPTPTTTPTTTPSTTPMPPNIPTTTPTTPTTTPPMNPTPPSGGGIGGGGGDIGGGGGNVGGGGDAGGGGGNVGGGGDAGGGGGNVGGGDAGGGGGNVGGGDAGGGGGNVGGGVVGGGGNVGGGGGGGGPWCVAKPSASEKALQVGLDYACGYGGTDCSVLQSGGSCYNPNTVKDHASYAYNDYYQKNPAPTSCDFGGTAQLVNTDPSSGSCRYTSKGSTSTTPMSPPTTPTPPMQTPPTTFSPPSPSNQNFPPLGGASGFGPEPTGSPNMATATSQEWVIFFSSTSIIMYILLANHL